MIGDNTTINEYCYLDGRGGLRIGDNVNMALYSMVITGSHKYKTKGFDFYTEPVVIEDDVWIATRAIILNGSHLKRMSVVGAGAVILPHSICEENTVYSGNPAHSVKKYDCKRRYLKPWTIHFR